MKALAILCALTACGGGAITTESTAPADLDAGAVDVSAAPLPDVALVPVLPPAPTLCCLEDRQIVIDPLVFIPCRPDRPFYCGDSWCFGDCQIGYQCGLLHANQPIPITEGIALPCPDGGPDD